MRDWNKNGKRDGCGEDVVFLGVLLLILGVILLLGLMFA